VIRVEWRECSATPRKGQQTCAVLTHPDSNPPPMPGHNLIRGQMVSRNTLELLMFSVRVRQLCVSSRNGVTRNILIILPNLRSLDAGEWRQGPGGRGAYPFV
jgi:hypothetical protein